MSDLLFRFGSASFANKIKANSYKITPNARQDLDSYRDETGFLHRNALGHTATIVEFDTIPMWDRDMQPLLSSLGTAGKPERDAMCTYYDPEGGGTKSGHFYLDSNFTVNIRQVWGNRILYDSCHFKFVEY